MRSTSALLLVPILALAGSAAAEEPQKSALAPERYAPRFKDLPFDGDLDALSKAAAKALTAENADRVREAKDPHERDRIKAELEARVQALRDSLVEFKGQRTGYNVSVVAGEFAHNSGEAMAVWPVGRAHDYFFFMRGALWKVVTTESTKQSFAGFLVTLTQVYGAPAQVEYRDPETREGPIRARWQDDTMALEVRDRPDYGAITLSWARRGVEAKLAELRGASAPSGEPQKGLDPTILDILKED